MRIILPIIAALIAPLVSAKGTFTLLQSTSRETAWGLAKPSYVQANKNDPTAHRMNATYFEVDRWNHPQRIPIIKFVMMGSMDDVQKRQLNDLSLLFTTIAPAEQNLFYCWSQTVHVTVENVQFGYNQAIEKRTIVDRVETGNINSVGARFRVTFKDIFKNQNVDPSNIFISVVGGKYCHLKFHVELEQPNNFGDTVPLKA